MSDYSGKESRPCVGSICHIGALTGTGCPGNGDCPLVTLNARSVLRFPIPEFPKEVWGIDRTVVADAEQPDNSDTLREWIDEAGPVTEEALAKLLPDADLKAAATALENDSWVCGDAKIRAQRILRIIERCAHRGLTVSLIHELDDLVDKAGPADCRAALAQHPDEVPF